MAAIVERYIGTLIFHTGILYWGKRHSEDWFSYDTAHLFSGCLTGMIHQR